MTLPTAAAFTGTEQVPPAERLQVVPAVNETAPVPAWPQLTVSPVTLPKKPVNVAVQELFAHVTPRPVVAVVTLTKAVPTLATLFTSPP